MEAAMKVSVCGKGGSGKSTLVSLLASGAMASGHEVLVVDSDESNAGLYRMLGFPDPPVPLMELVGGKRAIKEKIGRANVLAEPQIGIADIPTRFVRQRNGLKLVSIGKILQSLEGCACPMGVLSREFLNKLKLARNELVIVDMEAGVEHFGRGIDEHLNAILLVVEPSMESVIMAEKVKSLITGMDQQLYAVLNKVNSDSVSAELKTMLRDTSIDVAGVIPYDTSIFEACLKGHAIPGGKAFRAADRILKGLLHRLGG
jgi:CO dehydrogenase maturation factor